MRKISFIITFVVLFSLTFGSMFYKLKVLNLDFLPTQRDDIWNVEFRLAIPGDANQREYRFPVPSNDDRMKVISSEYNGPGFNLSILRQKDGTIGKWVGKSLASNVLTYRMGLAPQDKTYTIAKKRRVTVRKAKLEPLADKEAETQIREIEEDIVQPGQTNLQKIKAIYHFITDEISDTKKSVGMAESLIASKGNSHDKASLFTHLCLRQGIVARTVGGLYLFDFKAEKKKRRARRITYWNEIKIDGKWVPLSTTKSLFARLDNHFVPLFRGDNPYTKLLNDNQAKLDIFAIRAVSQKFDVLKYRNELSEHKSWLLSISLFHLPLSWQFSLKILLLIPIGTVLLSFSRNILGMKTFGIFMPILLALFFKESTLLFGLSFFSVIVLAGFFERKLLDRMRLLAVPKFSIILTCIILFLAATSLIFTKFNLFTGFSPTLFPIIITTIFIEKFTIMVEEEGIFNTAKILSGTVLLALGIYFLLLVPSLQMIIYTYPEILFSIIAIQIMIGKYTGFRLSELWRFRDFGRNAEKIT